MKDTIGRNNRKLADKICEVCGTQYRPVRATAKYCSRKCAWSKNGGRNKKPESWWVNSKGYVEGRVTLQDGSVVRVKKHRWIMSGMIGRMLRPDEDVHHINGDKTDNRPENLEILTHGDHSTLSNLSRTHPKGYTLDLTPEQVQSRSCRAIEIGLSDLGRQAIAKAKGETK